MYNVSVQISRDSLINFETALYVHIYTLYILYIIYIMYNVYIYIYIHICIYICIVREETETNVELFRTLSFIYLDTWMLSSQQCPMEIVY